MFSNVWFTFLEFLIPLLLQYLYSNVTPIFRFELYQVDQPTEPTYIDKTDGDFFFFFNYYLFKKQNRITKPNTIHEWEKYQSRL